MAKKKVKNEEEIEEERLLSLVPLFRKERKKGYSYALEFWEKHLNYRLHYVDLSNKAGESERLHKLPLSEKIKEDRLLVIWPENDDERELYNIWLLKKYLEQHRYMNLEIAKEEFFAILKDSPSPKKYIEKRLKEIQDKTLQLNPPPPKSSYRWYEPYELEGKVPIWRDVEPGVVTAFANTKYCVDFGNFLGEQLKELERDQNFKVESIEALDKVSHKIVLLFETGVIEHLKTNYKNLSDEQFAKLVSNIIGEENNVETIRKALVYINTTSPKNPINKTSSSKIKSLLIGYGIETTRI